MKKRIISIFLIVSIIASVCAIGVFTSSAATAAPTGLSLSNKNGYLHIQWNRVSGAMNYKMEYRTSKTPYWRAITTTQNYWNINNPQSGVKFDIRVTSLSKAGYIGGTSGIKTITYYIATPSITQIQNQAAGQQVWWTAIKGAVSYVIYFGSTSRGWVGHETVHSNSFGISDVKADGFLAKLDKSEKVIWQVFANGVNNTRTHSKTQSMSYLPSIRGACYGVVYDKTNCHVALKRTEYKNSNGRYIIDNRKIRGNAIEYVRYVNGRKCNEKPISCSSLSQNPVYYGFYNGLVNKTAFCVRQVKVENGSKAYGPWVTVVSKYESAM